MRPWDGDRAGRRCLGKRDPASIANGCLLRWRGDAGMRRAQEQLPRGSSVASRAGSLEVAAGVAGDGVIHVRCCTGRDTAKGALAVRKLMERYRTSL